MKIRNIAIIAHVDHGKTTLVDALLKQSENFSTRGKHNSGQDSAGAGKTEFNELIMDSNELERERGITIFSKNASIMYYGKDINPHTKNETGDPFGVGVKINIVDTPGHADFGGEVERIMRMVDGVLLLIDAKEGPMPQTKFVLKNAIKAGHKVIVVINKIDKPGARPVWALDHTFDLFMELGASDEQADFPIIYSSGIAGKAGYDHDINVMTDIQPLFESIIKNIPEPKVNPDAPLQMLTVNLAYDNYKGKIAIGRLYSGVLKKGMEVGHIDRAGNLKKGVLSSVMTFDGLTRVESEAAIPGDIVAIAGIDDISIGETITDFANPQPLPTITIEEPTVKMVFSVNTSPFGGKEGQYSTSNKLGERLKHELETDVALKVEDTNTADAWTVSGRGELHLSILIEKMRREGYEFQVSRPQVIIKEINVPPAHGSGEPSKKKVEPIERVSIEVPEGLTGVVMSAFGPRKGNMVEMRIESHSGHGGTAFMEFLVPTRGLIGFRNQFITSTKGQGIMNSLFEGYEEFKGEFESNPHGSLVASESGTTNSYGLLNAEGRGELFIGPGVEIYEGMIVGQNSKAVDLRVNVCKAKQLSNMRAKSDGGMEFLKIPRAQTLEDAIEFIGDDELVEITPKSIRLRKLWLKEGDDRRAKKEGA